MMNLDKRYEFLAHEHQWVSTACESASSSSPSEDLSLRLQLPPHQHHETWTSALACRASTASPSTRTWDFGRKGRVIHDAEHFTNPGGPSPGSDLRAGAPPVQHEGALAGRSAQVYFKVPEVEDPMKAAAAAAGVSGFAKSASATPAPTGRTL